MNGTYSVTVGNRLLAQPATLSVTDRDIAGLDLALLDNVNVRGSLVVDGGGLLPRVTLTFAALQERICAWLPYFGFTEASRIGSPTFAERSVNCAVSAPIAENGLNTWLVEGDYHSKLQGFRPAESFGLRDFKDGALG